VEKISLHTRQVYVYIFHSLTTPKTQQVCEHILEIILQYIKCAKTKAKESFGIVYVVISCVLKNLFFVSSNFHMLNETTAIFMLISNTALAKKALK
jgi:hypothetical protein